MDITNNFYQIHTFHVHFDLNVQSLSSSFLDNCFLLLLSLYFERLTIRAIGMATHHSWLHCRTIVCKLLQRKLKSMDTNACDLLHYDTPATHGGMLQRKREIASKLLKHEGNVDMHWVLRCATTNI